MTTKTTNKFSPGVRKRAVRMVQEHVGQYPTRWAAVQSIAAEIGCAKQTLHDRTRKAEVDGGKRAGVSSKVAEKLRALERENRELRQANEILRKASAYFAQTRGPTNVVISPGYLAQPHLASRPGAKLTVSATRSRVRHSRLRGHGTDYP